jgi:hypothetical protein
LGDSGPGGSGQDTAADTSQIDPGGDTSADSGEEDSGQDSGTTTGEWGDLSGDCGVLDVEEWESDAPVLFRNLVDFGDQEFDTALLSSGGIEIYEEGNLGGSSLHSEILAFEMLGRCEEAQLLKTEGEILYTDEGGKKTDLLVEIDGLSVGVSVTRAYHYPPDEPYTLKEGLTLLEDKLSDVLLSATNAAAEDSWARSMLHVIAVDATAADAIQAAHDQLEADVRDSTLLIVTVTDGNDDIVY